MKPAAPVTNIECAAGVMVARSLWHRWKRRANNVINFARLDQACQSAPAREVILVSRARIRLNTRADSFARQTKHPSSSRTRGPHFP
jgi:hypothetical protein